MQKEAVLIQNLDMQDKELCYQYSNSIINKLNNLIPLTEEESVVLYNLPNEYIFYIQKNLAPQIVDIIYILKKNLPPEIIEYAFRKIFSTDAIKNIAEVFNKAVFARLTGDPPPDSEVFSYLKGEAETPLIEVEAEQPSEEKLEVLIEESPEMQVLYEFEPLIAESEYFFNEKSSSYVDCSINCLTYLKAFGIQSAMWVIGPEHNCLLEEGRDIKDCCSPVIDGIPICDRLHASDLFLDTLIDNAYAHAGAKGYYPPKPIIAQSHPGCNCHLECWLMNSIDEIPNSAPGLPIYAEEKDLIPYKEEILNRLYNLSSDSVTIPIDRWTILSDQIYEEIMHRESFFYKERYKYGTIKWIENIKPVKIRKSFLYKTDIGLIRPIPDTYIGFKIENDKDDEKSKIYLVDFNYTIILSSDQIETIKIKPAKSSIPIDYKQFVKIDDMLAIIVKVFKKNKILVYVPEFNNLVFVKNVNVMEYL